MLFQVKQRLVAHESEQLAVHDEQSLLHLLGHFFVTEPPSEVVVTHRFDAFRKAVSLDACEHVTVRGGRSVLKLLYVDAQFIDIINCFMLSVDPRIRLPHEFILNLDVLVWLLLEVVKL